MVETYIINGVEVKCWYAGVDCYAVGDKVCYDLETLSRWVGVDVEIIKENM